MMTNKFVNTYNIKWIYIYNFTCNISYKEVHYIDIYYIWNYMFMYFKIIYNIYRELYISIPLHKILFLI